MTADAPITSPADPLAAARLVLDSLGVSPADLVESDPPTAKVVPTFAEFIPMVARTASPKTRTQWSNYWRVLEREWGDDPIDKPTMSDLIDLANKVQERSAARKVSRGGFGARSNFIDAVKCLYRVAVGDKIIDAKRNPAADLRRPKRLRTRRRALNSPQLAEITEVAGRTGPDPALDTLVLRQHTETACRRSGVLNLRNVDLNAQDCTIWLREKATVREQPVSRTLMNALIDHSQRRNPNGGPDGAVLMHADGRPLSDNYYQALWERLGKHVPWVAQRRVTAHWIRYTTLNWVDRNFGYATSAAYAGHVPGSSRVGNTLTYVEATLEELATVLAVLVREPHPLAFPGYQPGDDSRLAERLREPDGLLLFSPNNVGSPADLPARPIPQHVELASSEHLAAIRLVRHQLDRADQDGRRRPSQRALVHTTGLTPETVDVAFNALKIDWRDTSLQMPSADALARLVSDEPRRR